MAFEGAAEFHPTSLAGTGCLLFLYHPSYMRGTFDQRNL